MRPEGRIERPIERPIERRSETRADTVLKQLQTAIVQGDIAPGAKLNEPELARRFGTSRGPLREAIRGLQARRLVHVTPNAGARVVSLGVEQLGALYETREALEGMAARLAAERMPKADIQALERLLDEHAASIGTDDGAGYYQEEGDYDFHYRIVHGSGNAVLADVLLDDLYQLMRMYRFKFSIGAGRPAQALDEHYRILEAIDGGDGELAELLMRRHIGAARKRLQQDETTLHKIIQEEHS